MRIYWTRSAVTTVIFAIAGFLIARATLSFYPYVNWPGFCCLRLYNSIIQEQVQNQWAFLLFTSIVIYGISGFVIGAFARTDRQTMRIAGLFVIVILAGTLVWNLYRSYKRHASHSQLTEDLKQSALSRIEADPNDIFALHWMGKPHLVKTRRYKEAEKYFRKIVDLELDKGAFSYEGQRSLIFLATIYQYWGRHQEADVFYRKFIATGPDFKNDLLLWNYNNDYISTKQKQKK
jgi:tetratricopeptide (TPR) repeat protein